ncbi:hypothetical protein BH10PSE19_BH10PSE19_23080 [soil metagenome]
MTFVIKLFSRALGDVLEYFTSDMDVMSQEAKRIFSNEDDKRKYIEAVEKLKKHESESETIILSNDDEITLVS